MFVVNGITSIFVTRKTIDVIQSDITVYLQNNSVQTGFHSKKNHYRFITRSTPVGITSTALSNGN